MKTTRCKMLLLVLLASLGLAPALDAQTQVITTPVGGGGTGGTGTVTSVALAAPAIFSVTGSPVTTTGTFTLGLTSQAQNLVWASPDGIAGNPLFRALVAADIPALPESKVANLTTDLGTLTTNVSSNTTALGLRALNASPSLTGTPTAPTAAPATNSTQIATTAYADAVGALQLHLTGGTLTGQLVSAATGIAFNGSKLLAQGANILALSNLANAQTLRITNINDVDASPGNAEWLSIDWTTVVNTATISTKNQGTGTLRQLTLSGTNIRLQSSGVDEVLVTSTAMQPNADNAYDLGNSVKRYRDFYNSRAIAQQVGAQITAAATITPVASIFHVTGATPIATITVPAALATTGNGGCIRLIPDTAFTTTSTGGNIALSSTAVVNKVLEECWDNTAAKWFPSY